MKRWPLKLLLVVLMLASTATPAGAYWDDIHYSLTYYIARIVGFTPLQAYRIAAANLSTDYSAATEPVQMTAGDLMGAKMGRVRADAPEKQEPRWKYHAFRDVFDIPNAIGKGAGATRADAAITQQARALLDDAVNPGVFLHFAQDRVPHNEFGSGWGHYFDIKNPVASTDEARRQKLPIGGAVDWASYQSKQVVVDLVYNTAKWLDQFMARVSPHQRRNEYTFAGADGLINGLRGGARPVPLTQGELQVYEEYAEWQHGVGLNPNVPAAQESNFSLHVWGPDLKRASGLIDRQLQDMGMSDRAPDYTAARTKYTLDRWGHPTAAFDISGKAVPAAMDEWVLSGDLDLALNGVPGTDPVDVSVIAPSTMKGQAEYELGAARGVRPGVRLSFTQLPVGEISIEVKRNGTRLLRKDHVLLDKQKNQIDLGSSSVAATADYKSVLDAVAAEVKWWENAEIKQDMVGFWTFGKVSVIPNTQLLAYKGDRYYLARGRVYSGRLLLDYINVFTVGDAATAAQAATQLAQDRANSSPNGVVPERITIGGTDAWRVRVSNLEEVMLAHGPVVIDAWLDISGKPAADIPKLQALVQQNAEAVLKRLP